MANLAFEYIEDLLGFLSEDFRGIENSPFNLKDIIALYRSDMEELHGK